MRPVPFTRHDLLTSVFHLHNYLFRGRGYRSRYSNSLRSGRSGDRIPVGGEIFRARPDLPWGPTSLLHNGYRVIPGCKAAGAWRWPPTPSSAEVKERVEVYLYFSSGTSWPVLRWIFLPLFMYSTQFLEENVKQMRVIGHLGSLFIMSVLWPDWLD